MAIKVGINGFGRIGRNIYRAAYELKPGFEIVAGTFIDVDAPGLTPQVLARLRYSGSVARYFGWTTYDIRSQRRPGGAGRCGIVR